MDQKSRIAVVDLLRGLAALAVCWYHFTNRQGLLPAGWLRSSGAYGWLGVECFFVISGFVIPLSMYRGGFRLRSDWKTFFGKRIFRLEPPYLVSLLVTTGMWYVSARIPGFSGKIPNITFEQFIAHIGYMNPFFGFPWINPVFWTLAIEFQFYILIAIFYFLISSPKSAISSSALVGLALLSFLPIKNTFVIHYMAIFAFGILTFQYQVKLIDWKNFSISMIFLSVISFQAVGIAMTIVGILTVCTIVFVRLEIPRFFVFLGTISYSVYLFHVPIGGRIINLGKRFAHTLPLQILVLGCAVGVTLAVAYLAYCWIERPSRHWSEVLKYSSGKANKQSLSG